MPRLPKEHPSADGLTIPLAEREATFLFVAPGGSPATAWINHVSAVPPPDIEQVPVSIFAAADQRVASAAEHRLSRGVAAYSSVRQPTDCEK